MGEITVGLLCNCFSKERHTMGQEAVLVLFFVDLLDVGFPSGLRGKTSKGNGTVREKGKSEKGRSGKQLQIEDKEGQNSGDN